MSVPEDVSVLTIVIDELIDQFEDGVPVAFLGELIDVLNERHDIAPGMLVTPNFASYRHQFVNRWQADCPALDHLLDRLESLVLLMDLSTFRTAITRLRCIKTLQLSV